MQSLSAISVSGRPIRAVVLASLIGATTALHGEGAVPLTTAAQVRALKSTEVARRPAVRLRGVITFHEPQTGLTFLQDDTAGVAVDAGVPSRLPAEVGVGKLVDVIGVAAASAFAPAVTGEGNAPPQVTVLGPAPRPAPLELGAEQLSRGLHDGRWIEMRGFVRSLIVRKFRSGVDDPTGELLEADAAAATRLRIDLGTVAGRFTVIVPWEPGRPPPSHLAEARVRVRGVLGSITNKQRQWAGILLFVPTVDDIVVERPPTVDPFTLPLRETDEVLRFSPVPPEEERVRVEGVVTLLHPGFRIFIRGRRGSLEVQTTHSQAELTIGTRVEVVGYPTLLGTRVALQDAQFRILAQESVPVPVPITLPQAIAQHVDAEFVRLTGRLTQHTQRGSIRVLLVESDGRILECQFAMTLDAGQRGRIERVRLGSEVEVTGIAIMQSRSVWDGTVRSSGINLLLQDAAAVRVVRGPPWWTPTVLLRIVAVLVALVVLGTVWVYLLRRRVEQQTAIIRRNFEREAIWEERSRIARDIHDDVGAALTQISLLGELGRREGASAADMHGQLARVTAKSREAVRALDEIVWTVNPRNDSVARAASYICQAVQDLLRDSGIRCRLQVPDDLPDAGLAARVRHNLFLAVKEAVNNVIKHAGAAELRLALTTGAGEFGVRIEDNGCGFDPAGVPPERNGLGNMRRRLADVGGRCEITAGIGRGNVVAFIVPITGATSNEGWQETRK